MKAKFQLTILSALRGHGGNATREWELTKAEEEDLRHSWDLYRKFLGDDVYTKEMLAKIYGPGKVSALNTPEKRACWRVGHETQICGSFDLIYNDAYRYEWTATEAGSVTVGYDDHYRALGASSSRQAWEV
jgi:hypothetical protein